MNFDDTDTQTEIRGSRPGSLRLQAFGVTEPDAGAAGEACMTTFGGYGVASEYDVERK